MASYTADYTNDLGRTFKQVSLIVYLLETSNNNEATLINTSLDYDSNFLPTILKNHFLEKRSVCEISNGSRSIRQAIASISQTQKLHIPCPFRGGSPSFDQFFQELNAKDRILLVELDPEVISTFYVPYYSR